MGFFSYNFSLSTEQLSRRIIEKLINFFWETEEKISSKTGQSWSSWTWKLSQNFRRPRSPNVVGCSRVGDGLEINNTRTGTPAANNLLLLVVFLLENCLVFYVKLTHCSWKENQVIFYNFGWFWFWRNFQCISGFFSNLFTRAPIEHLFWKTWQTFPLGQEVWGKQGTKRLICSCCLCLGENIPLILTKCSIMYIFSFIISTVCMKFRF